MNTIKSMDSRIGILDPLRFLAAIMVMFYHYLPFIKLKIDDELFNFFEYGYLGVNFFFMLSGFVIMASAQNRAAIKFAVLRALRLYPAFIVCLLVTLVVIYCLNAPLPSGSDIFLNALIINDYFDVKNIDSVYWTLQAELKFYACVFLLILFGQIQNYKWWLSIWLLAAIFHHFFKQPFFMGWFISPSYSFYFIGGISAYLVFLERKNFYAISIFIIAMVFAILKSWNQIEDFVQGINVYKRSVSCLIAASFFVFFFFLSKISNFFKYTRLMAVLGGMSYPLYLLHSRAGNGVLWFLGDSINPFLSLLLAVVLVLGASFLVHYTIEKPLFRAVRHKVN